MNILLLVLFVLILYKYYKNIKFQFFYKQKEHLQEKVICRDIYKEDIYKEEEQEEECKKIKLKITNPEYVKQIYKLLFDVKNVLESNKINYWISDGTMLGAVRHNGLIPWDDDLDISMHKKDEYKLLSIVPILNKMGIDITKIWFGYKLFFKNGKKIKMKVFDARWTFPFLDIFIVKDKINNKGKYEYTDTSTQNEYEKCNIKKVDLYPLKKYKFGNYQVYGPNKYREYLKKCYGLDWNSVAYIGYDHENERNRPIDVQKQKIFLRKKCDYGPAQPINF
jgi:lipopolysaccharide cholinephosphotransferase